MYIHKHKTHIYIHIYIYKYLVWNNSPCLLTKFLINIYNTIFATSTLILSSVEMLYFFDRAFLIQMMDVRRRLKLICSLTHALVANI